MSKYKTEYFQDFDEFKIKQLQDKEPVAMTSYGNHSFNFYELGFENGVKAYLFDEISEAHRFVSYCNIDNKFVKFLGETNDVNERVIVECVKRRTDFIDECNRLSDERKYLLLVAPFELSYEKNPEKELQELLKNVRQ